MYSLFEPEIATQEKITAKMKLEPALEGQVIMHFLHQVCFPFCFRCKIEIYPDIHLISDTGSKKANLIHIANRSSSLKFTSTGEFTRFTLVFSALPKSCRTFDLIEPGENGWKLLNIPRNTSDVYHIKLHAANISLINNTI
jgi:hypothetical protein